jgi:3-oxoacyl-[acyl-carrier protein] reductase
VETAMTDKLNDEQRTKILVGVPVGRMGHPHEIAAGVLYLASHEAAYVTGATLDINGGGDML